MNPILSQIFVLVLLFSLIVNCTPLNDPYNEDTDQEVANARLANRREIARLFWDVCRWPLLAILSVWSINSIVSNFWEDKRKYKAVKGLREYNYAPRPRGN
jgi:hypothetical protein